MIALTWSNEQDQILSGYIKLANKKHSEFSKLYLDAAALSLGGQKTIE